MCLFRTVATFSFLALASVPSAVFGEPCDPGLLSESAPVDGYKAVPGTAYCEGFIKENNANEIQVVYFEMKGIVTPQTRWLQIDTPKIEGTGSIKIQGMGMMLGVPYRFNASTIQSKPIDVDLKRIIIKNAIPVDSIGFVALPQNPSPDTLNPPLIPVLVKDKDTLLTPGKLVIGVRLPSATMGVQYRFRSGTFPSQWKSYVPVLGNYGISEFAVDDTQTAVVTFEIEATLNGGGVAILAQPLRVKP